MYKIMGKCKRHTEEIDTAQSLEEAQRMVRQYQVAYGQEWKIWYEKL